MSLQRNLTPNEAAELLGVAVQTLSVWRCNKRYDLPYLKIGRKIMYRPVDIDSFLERHVVKDNAVNY